jgi:hypothetical protein
MNSAFRNGVYLGTLIFLTAAVAPAAPKTPVQSSRGAALLREIKADAAQVQSAAAKLGVLTKNPNASWMDYDRQWNLIKPQVEDMQIKLAALENLQAGLSPAERTELDQCKTAIQQIQSSTHALRMLLDKPGVRTSNKEFKAYASSLQHEAANIGHTTSAS